jgi:hypothetical protein
MELPLLRGRFSTFFLGVQLSSSFMTGSIRPKSGLWSAPRNSRATHNFDSIRLTHSGR